MIRGPKAHVFDRLDPRSGRLVIASMHVTNSILMYSCEPSDLQPLLSPGIEVDVIGGRGHLAVAFVDQRDFRPRGFPKWVGRGDTSTRAGIDVSISLEPGVDEFADYDELSMPRSFNFQYLKRSDATLVTRGVLKRWAPRATRVVDADLEATR